MNITYGNSITVEEYNMLRDAIGALPINSEQTLAGIKGSALIVTALDGDKIVGVARLIWDGGYSAFIKNVMVLPEYERKGIGSGMVKEIISYLKSKMEPGYIIALSITSARGKELFWSKAGFYDQTEDNRRGMEMVLRME